MDKFPSRERAPTLALGPRVSAVIVARGLGPGKAGQAHLDLCLRSVLVEPWVDDVVVVDNGNAPEVSSALRALQADRRDVRVVGAPIGASLAAATNMGATQARGRWLLLLSPDVVVRRGAVQRMAAAGADAGEPIVVGGRLTDTSGRDLRVVHAGKLNAFSALTVALEAPVPRLKRRHPRAVGAVSGSLMLVRREHFQALGGLDAGFTTDYADLDFCRRAAKLGGAVVFQPEASGVQFARSEVRGRRRAQGLALFAARCAESPAEKAFALAARPLLLLLIALREFVAGRPPPPR